MTPVGHSLTGLAIGYAVLPGSLSLRQKLMGLTAFVVLANAPDLPLPYWGHDRYDISHSLFVTLVAVGICVWLASRWDSISRRVLVGGAVAWYSHLLLDTFYNHGNGLAMFWPFSPARVALPIACFQTMKINPLLSMRNLQVFATEGLIYGLLLMAVVLLKPHLTAKTAKAVDASGG